MDFVKSSFLFLTFVFLAPLIKCEDDFNLEFSVQYNYTAKQWLVVDLRPILNNAPFTLCKQSNGTLESDDYYPLQAYLSLEKTWNEFGPCFAGIKLLNDQSKFLSEASRLFNKYNMNDILYQSNITLGNNYTYQEISDAVSKVTQGIKPAVKCFQNPVSREGNNLILDKITLFFDKSLNLIDPLKHHYHGMCSKNLPIVYDYPKNKGVFACFPPFKFYDDPLDKYPTLREDDNGYYFLSQKLYPAECPEYYSTKCNSTKCQKSKYSWVIREFRFIFKDNIDFSCDAYDPHHYATKYNLTSLSSIENEILDKWEHIVDSNCEGKKTFMDKYWEEQGMCSVYFKELKNEFEFYNKSLELFDKYNMETILRQSNITPGKNYTYQEIYDAASKGVGGKRVRIRCIPYEEEFEVMSIIEFVMDKNFNPTNPIDNQIHKFLETQNNYDPYVCDRNKVIFYRDFDHVARNHVVVKNIEFEDKSIKIKELDYECSKRRVY